MKLTSSPVLAALLAATALAAEPAAPVDPLRLTRTVEPVAQAVELDLDPAKDDYTGRVRINVVVHEATASFRLHALGPRITTASLTDSAGRALLLAHEVTEPKLGFVTLTAPAPLVPGAYVLAVAFGNRFTRDGLGLYKAVSRGDAYLFTQFEDDHARKAFPCWDEPSFKIPWQLTVTVPAGAEVVSNYPAAQESRQDGVKTIAFGRTPPMPSYLVALAVGPFEFTPVPGLSVPGRIVSPRGQSALAAEAVKLSPALLSALETYFGVPYPYAKLDQLGVPEYVYGAMENTGLITYRDTLLLLDPQRASFSSRRSLSDVIAHEMAHMWFGNLVTMSWWDDLWLNESFADWMAAKIIGHVHPGMRTEIAEVASADTALRADAQPSVRPICRAVPASAIEMEDAELIYNKGKAILRMVEGWIGEENFRAAMRAYFEKHRWGNTTAADLWAAFDTASGEDISALLAGFIERPGVPMVAFALLPDGKLELAQSRFLSLASDPAAASAPSPTWQIPVTFTWSAQGRIHRERILLRDAVQTVAIPGLAAADWIFPNTGQGGYYRWTLPPALNARLAARAAAVLDTSERLGLLTNAAAALDSGRLPGADYLAYLAAFARDDEPEVVQRVVAGLARLRDLFVTPAQIPAFNALRLALLRPALDRIGLAPAAGEPEHLSPLRSALLEALGAEPAAPDVIALARRLTADFLRDPAAVDPALVNVAVTIAAYHGDAALFDAFLATLSAVQTPATRSATITGLTGFHDPVLAGRALELSLTPALNSTEFLRAPYSLAGDPALRPLVVDWFITHYAVVKAKGPGNRVAAGINLAGNDPLLFERLREFLLDPARAEPRIASQVVKAADRVALATRLRETESANFADCLATFPGKAPTDRSP